MAARFADQDGKQRMNNLNEYADNISEMLTADKENKFDLQSLEIFFFFIAACFSAGS
jgi:hypothetical protein